MNDLPLPATMKSPQDRRPAVWRGGVLQIWVTRGCDKSCFGCTQGSNLGGKPGKITPEQFEIACQSLTDYFGVVGMFGGNPATHPQFETLCEIMRKHIPQERRGLWCNNLHGKGAAARATFNPAVSNLNVHLDRKAYDEFKRDWPEASPFGLDKDSRHAPPFIALQDVIPDEAKRWELIGACDVNQHWSAIICVFRNELRGFFCEIAGAQAMLHQENPDYPDLGHKIVPGWWNRPMADFAEQARFHCHACGIPLRGHGELAIGGTIEQVSQTHLDIYKPKQKGREVQTVLTIEQVSRAPETRSTNYMQKGK